MASDLIAVTGVTGYLGSRVAARLSLADAPLRLIARTTDDVPSDLNEDVAYGDYGNQSAMTQALAGATTLFFVSGREDKDRLEQHRRVVAAATEAGVKRIVYTSFLNAAADSTFTLGRQHHHTEQFIRASGCSFVFLRDSMYTDFIPFFVGEGGMIRAPGGEGRVSFVTRDDIVGAASAAVLDRKHDNTAFGITGPEAVSLAEAAERLGRFIGRPIGYIPETEEEAYRSREVYGAPDWEVEGWVTSYLAIAKGEMETVTDAVETLTGNAPRSIEAFLEAHPESYQRLLD